MDYILYFQNILDIFIILIFLNNTCLVYTGISLQKKKSSLQKNDIAKN